MDRVTFTTRRSDNFVNCTELCSSYGQVWGDYRSRSTTTAVLHAMAREAGVSCYEDLIDSRSRQGTWAHKCVAMHLLLWLKPELYYTHVYSEAGWDFVDVVYSDGFIPPPLQLTDISVVKPLAVQLQNKVRRWFDHMLKTGEYDELYRYAQLKGATGSPPGFVTQEYLFQKFEQFCDDSRLRTLYRVGAQGFCKRLRMAGFAVPSNHKTNYLYHLTGVRLLPANELKAKLDMDT